METPNLEWLETYRQNHIICPHCQHEFSDSWEYDEDDNGEIHCESCGESFNLEVETEVKYTTKKL